MAGNTEEKKAAANQETPAPAPGGVKAMLPLIITVVMMPILAFVMTNFVLLPKLTVAVGRGAPAESHGEEAAAHGGGNPGHGEQADNGHGSGHGEPAAIKLGKSKIKVPLHKLVVNVAGSKGSRLLLCSVTLVSGQPDFKSTIESNDDMLRDLASSVLASKTITDLEKPDSRNLIRSELLSQFNAALGHGLVEEIYLTELAIQ